MKKFAVLLIATTALSAASAQSVGIGTDTPNANAALDIESPSKGLLIPRVTTTARQAITATKGLMVFDVTTNSFWYHDGTIWNELASTANTWSMNGNFNITPGTHFLGTWTNHPLEFRVYERKSGIIDHIKRNYGLGHRLMDVPDAGEGNIGIGQATLHSNHRNYNIAIGDSVLHVNGLNWIIDPQSVENIGIGRKALYRNTVGYRNVAIGSQAMEFNQAGGMSTGVGYFALHRNNAAYNTGIGAYTLQNSSQGVGNTAGGAHALQSNTSGQFNAAHGYLSMQNNTTGQQNTAIGYRALQMNVTGRNNTAIGANAMYFAGNGNYNVGVGNRALSGNDGDYNTAVGDSAMMVNGSGTYNAALGARALRWNSAGSENTAVGRQALYSNTTGSRNVAVGSMALQRSVQAGSNTAVGHLALTNLQSGNFNVAVGYQSMESFNSGTANTGIGYGANGASSGLSNSTGLGFAANCNASHQVRIGNVQVLSIGGAVGWTTLSDSRFKSNERSDVQGLAFITALRPISYNLNTEKLDDFMRSLQPEEQLNLRSGIDNIRFTGFNAQEVEALAKQLGFDFSGIDAPKNENDFCGLRYGDFVVPLVKAVQEQQAIINDLQKQIDELKKLINK